MMKIAGHPSFLTLVVLFTFPIAAGADDADSAERTERAAGYDCSFENDSYTRKSKRLRVVESTEERTTGPGYVHTSTTYILTPAGCGDLRASPKS